MNSEILYVNDHPRPHWVVTIPGDGSCLFHSLSFCINGHMRSSYEIRLAIAEYVVAHWDDLQVYTCDERGEPYLNADLYKTAMVRTTTYGSASELKAAAALYPYTFEVYEKGHLRGLFGDDSGHPVRRLRFSGSFRGGHYDVLLPKVPSNSEDMNESHKDVNENGGGSQNIAIDQEIKEEAARDSQINPENLVEALSSYNLPYPEVPRAPIATDPEVCQRARPFYKKLHPKLNLESIQRKKSDMKLKSQALTNKIKSGLQIDKLIIWVMGYRRRTLENFNKTVDKLKTIFKISLENLSSCPPDRSLEEGLESFLGKSEQISNQEPQEVYNFMENKEKAVEVNDTQKEVEVLGNVTKHGHYLTWSCSDFCAMDEDIMRQLTSLFETLVNKNEVEFFALIEKENLIQYFNSVYNHKPHFPRLRTISEDMFKLTSIFNILIDVDISLHKMLQRKSMERQKLTTLL